MESFIIVLKIAQLCCSTNRPCARQGVALYYIIKITHPPFFEGNILCLRIFFNANTKVSLRIFFNANTKVSC